MAASVGVLIFDDYGNFLFEKRAKEPKKGMLTQPGGFIDADEKAEQAIERECMEELGAKIIQIKYLGTYPNTYEYKNITYKTCDMFFTAKLSGCKSLPDFVRSLKKQETEVEEVVIQKITSPADVESLPLAFVSTRNALKDFFLQTDEGDASCSGYVGSASTATSASLASFDTTAYPADDFDSETGDELLWI
mgnify:CR=1 FL=1